MRLDDLPESGNIEDRRGEAGYGGGGGFGLPIGGGGLSIGTIVVLGIIGWARSCSIGPICAGNLPEDACAGTYTQSEPRTTS